MDVCVHETWLKKFLDLGRTRVLLEREGGALYIGDQIRAVRGTDHLQRQVHDCFSI